MSYTEKQCIGCDRILPLPPKTLCLRCRTAIQRSSMLEADNSQAHYYYSMRDLAPVPGVMYNYKSAPHFSRKMADFLKGYGCAPLDKDQHQSRNTFSGFEGSLFPKNAEDGDQIFLVKFGSEQRQLYSIMLYALAECIREAQLIGQEKGQNLLFQLNAGTISLDDFNDKLLRAEARKS